MLVGIGIGTSFPVYVPSRGSGQDWCSTIAEGETRILTEDQTCTGILTCNGWLVLEDAWLTMNLDGGE